MKLATKFKLTANNSHAQQQNANSSKQECADCGSSSKLLIELKSHSNLSKLFSFDIH